MSFNYEPHSRFQIYIEQWNIFLQNLEEKHIFDYKSFITGLNLRVLIDHEIESEDEILQTRLFDKFYKLDCIFYANTLPVSNPLISPNSIREIMLYTRIPLSLTANFQNYLRLHNITVEEGFDYLQDLFSHPYYPKMIDRSYEY